MAGRLAEHVLLVDDDAVVRTSISRYLKASGYFIRTAVDGLDALGKMRVWLPDLIIADLNMPRMSGFELLKVVRKRFPQIPAVIISEAAAEQMPEDLAADAYFHKNGAGLEPLLLTVYALAKMSLSRSVLPPDERKPVPARWDEKGHYNINCEDCLRELCIPRPSKMKREENWTVCVHCGRVVRFQIAHCDSPVSARQ